MADIRKSTPTAPALEKGLDIIGLLAARGRPMALREVAEELGRSRGLPETTCMFINLLIFDLSRRSVLVL